MVLTGNDDARLVDNDVLVRSRIGARECPLEARDCNLVTRDQVLLLYVSRHIRGGCAVVGLALGDHHGADGLLADIDAHVMQGRLPLTLGLRGRDGNVCHAARRNRLHRQDAGGGIDVDIALAACLDAVGNRTAVGRGAHGLVRIAVGDGVGYCVDGLRKLLRDCHYDVLLQRIVVVVACDGDLHDHAAHAGARSEDTAAQRAAKRVALNRVADGTRRVAHLCRKVNGGSGNHEGRVHDRRGIGSLGDRDLHVLGRLAVGVGLRSRHGDVRDAGLLGRQRAGGGVHVDEALAAGLDGVADRAACRSGHGADRAGAHGLVRVTVGGGYVLGGNDLRLPCVDRHGDGRRLHLEVVVVFRDGDVHRHAVWLVGVDGRLQDAALERAAPRVVAERVADGTRRAVRVDIARQVDGAAAHHGGCARDRRGVGCLGDGELAGDAGHVVVGVVTQVHVDGIHAHLEVGRVARERVVERVAVHGRIGVCREVGRDAIGHGHVIRHDDGVRALADRGRGRGGDRHLVALRADAEEVVVADDVRLGDRHRLALAGVRVCEGAAKTVDYDEVVRSDQTLLHGGVYLRVGRAVVVLVLGVRRGDDGLLADGHLHFLGRLGEGVGLRCRRDDGGGSGLLGRQHTGGGVHVDSVLAARLDGVGDRAASLLGRRDGGVDGLIRVTVDGVQVIGGDGLLLLGIDRYGDGRRRQRQVVAVLGDGDVHLHGLARVGTGGGSQDTAFQRAAVRIALDRVAHGSRRAIRVDVAHQAHGASAIH